MFEPANTSSLGAAMDGDTVVAWAVGGPYGEGYSFEFAAPPGEQLEPRNYIGAQRLPFRTSRPSRPRCDRGEPRLQHARRAFRVARPDARRRRQRRRACGCCSSSTARATRPPAGERSGSTSTPRATVRWPPLDSWREATPVPVSPTAQVVGSDAFRVDGGLVRFVPTTAGTHEATLQWDGHETRLEGFAYGGTTSATVEVIAGGDVAGQPGTYTYGPENAEFGGRTYDTETSVFVDGADNRWFEGRFGAGGATPLAPGAYGPATTDYSSQPWLRVSGSPILLPGDRRRLHRPRDLATARRQPPLVRRLLRAGLLRRPSRRPPRAAALPGRLDGAARAVAGRRTAPTAPRGDDVAASDRRGLTHFLPPVAAPQVPPPRVRAAWRSTRAGTRARRLIVEHVPAGARVQVRCLGRPCPFSRRTVPVRDGRADAGRRLRRVTLRPGTVLELRVGTVAVVRYTIRRARKPTVKWVRGRPGPAATAAGTAGEAAAPPRRRG